MSANVDDYYSSISSDSSDDSKSEKKKPIIKKKIILKTKKVTKSVAWDSEDSQQDSTPKKVPSRDNWENLKNWTASTQTQKTQTLNDALETSKSKTGGFTIVRRSDSTQQKNVSSSSESSSNTTWWYKTRWSSNSDTPVVSSAPKFKAGFTKNSPKPGQSYSSNDEKWVKKWKNFLVWKKGKYKDNYEEDGFTRSNKIKHKKKEKKSIEDIEQNLTAKTGETVILWDVVSIKEFSEKIWVPFPKLIAEFMKNGMMMTINAQVDFDTASLIAEAFDVKLQKDNSAGISALEIATWNIKDLLVEEDSSKLLERPPVVSIMWHVDHGKTSLLDYIRKEQVAAGEAGWITQSIWAYQAEYNGKKITFLDTPGHEAFTVMRARGAKLTDIAILVVAADEWVKPQTIESISHAKEAGIPVIVAINKMDKEWANPDHVKGKLAEHGLTPEDWWGETPMVPVSAHTGFGIDDLLEIILLVSEIQEFKANPDRNGVATIIESHLDTRLGPVATLLVNTGTIEKWSAVVCWESYGKIKVLRDYTGKSVKFVKPGQPALIVGLDKVVWGGDVLQVMNWIEAARQKAVEYSEYISNQKQLKSSQLDILMSKIKSWNLKHLKVVLKADTNGSLEAIKNALINLSTEETSVSIIYSWVWNITEWDVLMCGWSSALLVGFNVQVGPNAKNTLEDSGVEYIESKIIYHITEKIEKIVTGMLDPKEVEIVLCEAKVGGIFFSSKQFMIVGLQVSGEDQNIENKALVRVIRWGNVVAKGKIESLKQWVEEVNKIEGVKECGIKLVWTTNIEMKDTLEIYKIVIEK